MIYEFWSFLDFKLKLTRESSFKVSRLPLLLGPTRQPILIDVKADVKFRKHLSVCGVIANWDDKSKATQLWKKLTFNKLCT